VQEAKRQTLKEIGNPILVQKWIVDQEPIQ